MASTTGDRRGRLARRPIEIPRHGWKDILLRTWDGIAADNLSMIAAAVAFYGLLAIFPAIAAAVSIWALVFDPAAIESQISGLSEILPPEAAAIVTEQARSIDAGSGVSWGAVIGILLSLYAASRGMKAMMNGLNIAYGEREKRGFIWLNVLSFALTLGAIVGLLVALGLIAALPGLVAGADLGGTAETLILLARWPLLFVFAIVGLAVLYRVAPSRAQPHWRWVTWGAVAATLVWLVASIAFAIYVRNFGSYNETYGSIGAVAILLLWLWLTALIGLVGAKLDAEIEHQTTHDSTLGPPKPMGERGAYVADTEGEARD